MRVVTAFKRMLRLDGWASVTDVSFDRHGVIVALKLRARRRRVCSVCGQTGRHLEIVDYRTKTWRHLDLGAKPLHPRVRAAAAALPGLRRAIRGGPLGPARLAVHPRL
jgi:hypothetical protein